MTVRYEPIREAGRRRRAGRVTAALPPDGALGAALVGGPVLTVVMALALFLAPYLVGSTVTAWARAWITPALDAQAAAEVTAAVEDGIGQLNQALRLRAVAPGAAGAFAPEALATLSDQVTALTSGVARRDQNVTVSVQRVRWLTRSAGNYVDADPAAADHACVRANLSGIRASLDPSGRLVQAVELRAEPIFVGLVRGADGRWRIREFFESDGIFLSTPSRLYSFCP